MQDYGDNTVSYLLVLHPNGEYIGMGCFPFLFLLPSGKLPNVKSLERVWCYSI